MREKRERERESFQVNGLLFQMTQQEESAGGGGLGKSTVQRVFRLLFDVRSFKSNRKFPFNRSKVVVVVSFPDSLEDAINADPTKNLRIGQLRSRPAVEVARGSEVLIPNSFLEINFTTTALRFASTLADDPQCKVQVFREDRYRSDMLLGEALVPLQPLLTQPWIDGYAPVMELNKQSRHTGNQLGSVRVVVAVEEVGVISSDEQAPLQAEESSQAALTELRSSTPEGSFQLDAKKKGKSKAEEMMLYSDTESEREIFEKKSTSVLATSSYMRQSEQSLQSASEKAVRLAKQAVADYSPADPMSQPVPAQAQAQARVTKPSSTSVEQITSTQEYASAWEFEVWRSAEEARWRAEMKEKEIARMAYIQKEWNKRENQRLEEIGRAQNEVESLQKNLKKSLISVEEREKKLVMAEEALSRRRKEIEREAATRALESQAAIQRTKEEYQCKLDIERAKVAQGVDLQQATENRLHRIQASFDKIEREYQEYREKVRNTSESELQMQILGLQSELQNVKGDKLKLQHARVKHKEVVAKLERQLQWAHSMIQQEHSITSSGSKYSMQANQLNNIAETGLKSLQEDQAELSRLREQISQLRKVQDKSENGKPASSDNESNPGLPAPNSPDEASQSNDEAKVQQEQKEASEKSLEKERLVEEMNNLLGSGIYSRTDPIILTLEQRINLLSS